jgi:hypothetical protein
MSLPPLNFSLSSAQELRNRLESQSNGFFDGSGWTVNTGGGTAQGARTSKSTPETLAPALTTAGGGLLPLLVGGALLALLLVKRKG